MEAIRRDELAAQVRSEYMGRWQALFRELDASKAIYNITALNASGGAWRGSVLKKSPIQGQLPADFGPIDRAHPSGCKTWHHLPP